MDVESSPSKAAAASARTAASTGSGTGAAVGSKASALGGPSDGWWSALLASTRVPEGGLVRVEGRGEEGARREGMRPFARPQPPPHAALLNRRLPPPTLPLCRATKRVHHGSKNH